MPTLTAPIAGIRTYHALVSIQTVTLTKQLSITLKISINALLGARVVPFGKSVTLMCRITLVVVPLLEHGHVLNSKRSARTCLIRGPRLLSLFGLSFSNDSPSPAVHVPSSYQVHVIIQLGFLTFLLRILQYASHILANLIPTIRN